MTESVRLTWRELSDGAMADGAENVYLIWVTGPEGLPVDVRFTRWRRGSAGLPAEALSVAREALTNAVVLPLGRGPGRPAGPPEAGLNVAFAKALLQGYEDGVFLRGYGSTWGGLPLADDDSEAAADAAQRRARWGRDPVAAGWQADHAAGLGFETGAPWRSSAEAEWDASRGD